MGIYLDNAATTKPYPEVASKVTEVLSELWGNPSSIHKFGEQSKDLISNARKDIASALGANEAEIFFTSGGTESINLAILGATTSYEQPYGKHIVTTDVEHSAVAKTVRNLRREFDCKVDYLPIVNYKLDLDALERSITDETSLVSVMLVQNEVGTIFPLHEISKIVRRKNPNTILHCDAVQGFGKIKFTVDDLGVDLLSVSAHKIHGVSGCGALYVKEGTKLSARQFGGGQEKGLRSGTESTAMIAAFSEAVRITFENIDRDISHITSLRDYTLSELSKKFPEVILITDNECAPHIVGFTFPFVMAEDVVRTLGEHEIYISNGSACKSNFRSSTKRKQALEYYGLSDEMVRHTLRVSFCDSNTTTEIDEMLVALANMM